MEKITPTGEIGLDRNLDNVTGCDIGGRIMRHSFVQVNKIKREYRKVQSGFRLNDARIKKRIFEKYCNKERKRVNARLHIASKIIVALGMGIILEDISRIRRLYRRGNGQGRRYRYTMNARSFYELQRQISYKAARAGLPVKFVNARGTSSMCAKCRAGMVSKERQMPHCPSCRICVDRSVNAGINMLARGLMFGPDGAASEAVMRDSVFAVILGVDAAQFGSAGILLSVPEQ